MAFYGCFGADRSARRVFDARAQYLCAPVLHFSFDGMIALCHDRRALTFGISPTDASLFIGTAGRCAGVEVGHDTIARLYRRYGRHLRAYLPRETSFALYDSKKGSLLLGAADGARCFFEYAHGVCFFASTPLLLRAPVAVELAVLKE